MDGVYTGVGFGFHNNRRLFYAGALVVSNPASGTTLRHLGILARPGNLSDLSSWVVGPSAAGRVQGVLGSFVITFAESDLPTLVKIGDKFQVLSGTQTGVYTIADLYYASGIATVVVTTAFPADPRLWGNRDVEVFFEVLWDAGICTWRVYANTRDLSMQVLFGGTSGGVVRIGSTPLASPAYLGPDVLPEGYGRILWGSLSRRAAGSSLWSFLRGQAVTEASGKTTRGTIVDSLMLEDPEDGPWYSLTPFGDSAISAGVLTLTSTPASAPLNTDYGYGYTDPFLNGKRVSAFDAKIRVFRDTAGAGSAAMVLQDTWRVAHLGTLLYQDVSPTLREIYVSPTVSLVGSVDYDLQGWISSGEWDASIFSNGREILLESLTGTDHSWEIYSAFSGVPVGWFLEFRIAITDFVDGPGTRIGLSFIVEVLNRSITLDFAGPDQILLRDSPSGALRGTYSVGWSDGVYRTYRLEFNGVASLNLYVNNTVVGGATAIGGFPVVAASNVTIRAEPNTDFSSFSASLESLCFGATLTGVAGLGRTFGLWLGGDPGDIDNWKIPRSDATTAKNSDASLAVPVTMDWSAAECWVRMFMDPTFGVSFIRPDLNPPPGYTGDFATESMNPSSGWTTVEYANLPRVPTAETYGSVRFGNLNPGSSTIQTWKDVRYRAFTHTSTDYRADRKMVLNRWNVVTSGDFLKDVSPETILITSTTATKVSLRPCGIYANRVFKVTVGGVTLDSSQWRFDTTTQDILLSVSLPSTNYPVGVTFAPGKPITLKYLESQPLLESQTILNEGTPPVPMSQVGVATVATVSGDGGVTPAFPPAVPADPNYFLRDQYLVQRFGVSEDFLYDRMSFIRLEDGGSRGSLASFCDGEGPREYALNGSVYSENYVGMGAADRGRGPGTWRTVLHASGGSAGVMGIIGPAVYTSPFSNPDAPLTGLEPSMTYPSFPSEGMIPGSDMGGIYREIHWVLRLGASPGSVISNATTPPYVNLPLIDAVPPPTDRNYASQGSALLSPSTVGAATGNAWSGVEYSSSFPRLGPWTDDLTDLAVCSLLYGTSALQPTGEPASGAGMVAQGGVALPDPPAPLVSIL